MGDGGRDLPPCPHGVRGAHGAVAPAVGAAAVSVPSVFKKIIFYLNWRQGPTAVPHGVRGAHGTVAPAVGAAAVSVPSVFKIIFI
jgi:hypothetical protein